MGKATKRQIEYCNEIAKTLNIPNPKPNFDDCFNFISQNKELYKIKKFGTKISSFRETGYKYPDNCIQDFYDKFGKDKILFFEKNLYKKAGCYAFADDNNQIIYIGKSINLAERIIKSYTERIRQKDIRDIYYYITPSKADASILEMVLITENKPVLNGDGITDDYSQMFKSNIDILKDFIRLKRKDI